MEKEKELTNVPGLSPDDVVVIKRFSWSQKNKLLSSALNVQMKSKTVGRNVKTAELDSRMDLYQLRLRTLLYGIKSAPFFRTSGDNPGDAFTQRKEIIEGENFDPDTGEFLYAEIDKLNKDSEITDEVEKKSEESSEDESAQTPI